jgi:hypothetical protein
MTLVLALMFFVMYMYYDEFYPSIDLAQFHGIPFDFHPTALSVFTFFCGFPDYFDLSITEET